jgi:DNA polymerase-3 subunit beta
MKALCTKKNLNQGLSICSRIIGSGNTLPVLNNILLRTDQGRIKFSSTNLELAVNTWVGGKIEEEGDITVPAKLINEYINNLAEEKITISSKNHNLFLDADQSKSFIKGLPSEEFPLIPEIGEGIYTSVSGQDLTRAINEVGFAASYSETQPEISGVLFSFNGQTLTLSATDRYRLAEEKIQLNKPAPEDKQIIVPSRAANELGRVFAQKENVEIFLSEGQAMFKSDDIELITRLIEGQYPEYQQIIPKNFTTSQTLRRTELTQALKAVSLFATDTNNIEIELDPKAQKVMVKSQSNQAGEGEVSLVGSGQGEKTSVVFNHRYLLECLNNISDDEVTIKVIDPSSPAAIVPNGRENYLYIVMPIKI